MIALAAPLIRARMRPVAIATVFLAELAWALVVATPVHAWVRRAWGAHPDGDSVLWLRGGRDLLVWLGQDDAGMSVTARTTIVLLAVGAALMQLPLGALLASLAFGTESAPEHEATDGAAPAARPRSLRLVTAWKVGVGAWLPLAGLLAFAALLAVIVLSLGGIVGSLVEHSMTSALGDARAFTVKLVVLALFAALAALLGVVVDLARAAVVREVGLATVSGTSAPGWSTMLRGVRIALVTTRRSFRRATLGWTSRAVVGAALLAIGYVAASALGGRGGSALTALFVIHQGVVLGRVALRASWLARAVALVSPVQDEHEAKGESQRAAADATSVR